MGVIYIIWPVDDVMSKYLQTLEIDVPMGHSRNPTPREVREVCNGLAHLKVREFSPGPHTWRMMIEGRINQDQEPWAILCVANFNGDENVPHSISFDKGWPVLIIRIVHALTINCGPLVIIADTGCKPLVVKSTDDVDVLLKTWEHTRGIDRC